MPSLPVTSFDLNSANWSTNAGFGAGAPGWYREVGLVDPSVVHLQGAVRQTSASGSNPNVIGTLSPAACPDRVVYRIVHTFNGTYADVAISPNGQITLIDPRPPAVKDYSFVSLEGIVYEQFLPVPNLIEVNLTNWSPNAGFGAAAPAWYSDGSFYVHLQGAVTQTSSSGSSANLIGTLLPPSNAFVYTIVHTFDGTFADVGINPSTGQIALIDPKPPTIKDYSFVSLEGIIFGSGIEQLPISLNPTNWSGDAGFGAFAPAWGKDAFGIVHLSGAAKQISSAGSEPNLIGILPTGVRPTRSVYTIVHTFNGTYADLVIEPNGQIALINPRAPAVTDYSFVSLDNITFQQ